MLLLKIGHRFELEIGRHMTFLRMGRYEAIYTRSGGLLVERVNA